MNVEITTRTLYWDWEDGYTLPTGNTLIRVEEDIYNGTVLYETRVPNGQVDKEVKRLKQKYKINL